MDNATRSERSRNVALDAALVIIARDGPGRLTLDAIARESGLSKGGASAERSGGAHDEREGNRVAKLISLE